jgi:predicted enzyme related to lactoylglutathione lyase
MKQARATVAHAIPDRPPIQVHPGEAVTVGDRDDDWPAFAFVTTRSGSGWVPARCLSAAKGPATVLEAYDTTELPTQEGEILDVVERDDESGWHWCRAAGGREGWVPARTLAPILDAPSGRTDESADAERSVFMDAPRTGTPGGHQMQFSEILIGSENPERLVDYYTRLFGPAGFSDGGYTGWQFGSAWLTIGPHDQVKGRSTHPGRIIWNLESADVKGDFERFKAAGATVIQEPYGMGDDGAETGGLIATFADPDDNYFQLMSPMPSA